MVNVKFIECTILFGLSADSTYIYFSIYDVYETAQNNDEIEHIPSIAKVILTQIDKEPIKC